MARRDLRATVRACRSGSASAGPIFDEGRHLGLADTRKPFAGRFCDAVLGWYQVARGFSDPLVSGAGDMGCLGGGKGGLGARPMLSLAARPTWESSADDEGSARVPGYSPGLPASHRPSGALNWASSGTVYRRKVAAQRERGLLTLYCGQGLQTHGCAHALIVDCRCWQVVSGPLKRKPAFAGGVNGGLASRALARGAKRHQISDFGGKVADPGATRGRVSAGRRRFGP